MNAQKGFTLIELMMAMAVIAVLAAIAMGSYSAYIIKNAESAVKGQMGQLELQLDSWRATTLAYRGFYPLNGVDDSGNPHYAYSEGDTVVYVPIGSNAQNYKYKIELFDTDTCQSGCSSLVPSDEAAVGLNVGRSWVMIATPNPSNTVVGSGGVFVQNNIGLRCAKPDATKVSAQDIRQATLAQECPADWRMAW